MNVADWKLPVLTVRRSFEQHRTDALCDTARIWPSTTAGD